MFRSNRAIQISEHLLESYRSSATNVRSDNRTISTETSPFTQRPALLKLANLIFGSELIQDSALSAMALIKMIVIGAIITSFTVILALKYSAVLLPLGVAPLFVLRYLAWRAAFKRAEMFERDYPAFLLALCSSIRTGLDPLAALQNLEQLFPATSELGRELSKLNQAIASGVNEERAIASFGRSIRHPDITLFRTAFQLARTQGSSLGEALHRLSRVTRTRQSFRRKMRGAVAMQRLSAFGILFCAIAIGIFQAVTSPAALRDAITDPIGKQALSAGLALVLIGIGWMIRLTRQRI